MVHEIHIDALTIGGPFPAILGVVNLSPESFYSDSFSPSSQAATTVEAMRRNGADIIDIGARSTALNAGPISLEEEKTRVVTALKNLEGCDIPLSLDTCRPEVLEAALRYDIALINDIGGLSNPDYTRIAADSGLPVIAMASVNTPGDPATLAETHTALQTVMKRAEHAGITDRLILDPGIGRWTANRSAEADWELCRHFAEFTRYGCPLLAAASRKRFISETLQKPAQDCLAGSLAVLMHLIDSGASLLRVHDVAETRDIVAVARTLQKKHIA